MNSLSDTDLKARLASIRNVWARRKKSARRSSLSLQRSISLDGAFRVHLLHLSPYIHYLERSYGVSSVPSIRKLYGSGDLGDLDDSGKGEAKQTRDPIGEAIIYLQILDLAIETGYLPPDQIGSAVLTQLRSIYRPSRFHVASPFASFFEGYSPYLDIETFLIKRGPIRDPTGSVHFAIFLSTDCALESDPATAKWLNFLDKRFEDHRDFYNLLKNREPAKKKSQQKLILGAQVFALMLADFLVLIPAHLQLRFARLYSYPLAEFFSLGVSRRDTVDWNVFIGDWSSPLKSWISEIGIHDDEHERMAATRLFDYSTGVLSTIWEQMQKSG